MLKRVALWVMYDGTAFSGYQVQPGKRTVQLEVEKALRTLHKGTDVRVHASGRTDTGVHARGQVLHFDSPLMIPTERWPKAINSCLPEDVRIIEASYVQADFHSRYAAVKKEYRYRVFTPKHPDVWRRNTTFHFPYSIDFERVKKAASYLLGTHDFSSFCASNTDVQDKVRTLYELEVCKQGDEIVFRLVGSGFLYNMVRIIVGTLLEVGIGKRVPDELATILEAEDRTKAGKTAPGNGLFLWKVSYEYEIFSDEF
ncbi:tRNA pseudouridine synthase A [Halalkalibacter krulwichiae]|uniref:tRNA pseudouridine synthase A n=1 Tax=Halalkalibacter krulwichiae TaxID=199441 RepID=A0A1Y9THD7_9BACI|nr:tRNA pseudouridine synthase A [Halalkalibacter krulwichiae]